MINRQTAQKINLIDSLQVIARRSRMIATTTVTAAVLGLVVSFLLPKTYTAKTMILPAQEDKGLMSAMLAGQVAGLAGLAGASVGVPTTAELYVSMLKSEAVKDPIIDQFKLMQVYDNNYRADTFKKLEKKVSVSAGKKDGIITITVDDEDPKRAAAMANAYVEELGKLAVRLNATGAGQNRAFLGERLASAKADLVKAEDDLKTFQARNKAVQVNSQTEATIKRIADLKAQLAISEVQLATYRRQLTESSQEVKGLKTAISNLNSQIAQLEGKGGSDALPSVGSVPAIGQEYVRLMREFKNQESLVELLTKQYEVARLTEAKDVSPFQVILKARVPEKKSRPLRSLIVLLTTLAGLLGSVFTVFVLDALHGLPDEEKKRLQMIKSELLFWRKQAARAD